MASRTGVESRYRTASINGGEPGAAPTDPYIVSTPVATDFRAAGTVTVHSQEFVVKSFADFTGPTYFNNHNLNANGPRLSLITPVMTGLSSVDGGSQTFAAFIYRGGLFYRTVTTGTVSDLLPTAANMYLNYVDLTLNDTFVCLFNVVNSSGNPYTLLTNTGVTLIGSCSVGPTSSAGVWITLMFRNFITTPGAQAYTVHRLDNTLSRPRLVQPLIVQAPVTYTWTTNYNWTVADVMKGFVKRTITTGTLTDRIPTAATISTAYPNLAVGDTWELNIRVNNTTANVYLLTTTAADSNATYFGPVSFSGKVWLVYMFEITGVAPLAMSVYCKNSFASAFP